MATKKKETKTEKKPVEIGGWAYKTIDQTVSKFKKDLAAGKIPVRSESSAIKKLRKAIRVALTK